MDNTVRPLAMIGFFLCIAPGCDPASGATGDAGSQTDAGDTDPNLIQPATTCGSPATLPPQVLLDVGHEWQISHIARSADRVLTRSDGFDNSKGRWILWDAATLSQLASGSLDGTHPTDLRFVPPVFVIPATSGRIEARSTIDGQLLASIDNGGYVNDYGVAADASYVWAIGAAGVSAWSPSGSPLFAHAGNYVGSKVFAAATELRIAVGPAGANIVEYLAAANGAQSVSPAFSGTFKFWFLDGERFLSDVGGNVYVYGKDGAQVPGVVQAPAAMGGAGDYFWNAGFDVYRLGTNAPVASFPGLQPTTATNHVVAAIGDGQAFVVHLDASGPSLTTAKVPPTYGWRFAVDDQGDWVAAGETGDAFLQGTPTSPIARGYLGCGRPVALAGASTGRIALSTSNGTTHILEATTGAYVAALRLNAQRLAISDDGAVLVGDEPVEGSYDTKQLTVRSLPEGTTVHAWTFPSSGPRLVGWSFATGSKRIARELYPSWERHVSDVTDTIHYYDDANAGWLWLSPSGKMVDSSWYQPSSTDTTFAHHLDICNGAVGRFFDSMGTILNAVNGEIIGWLDDDRVLLDIYTCTGPVEQRSVYQSAQVHDASGTLLANAPLPAPLNSSHQAYPVTATEVLRDDTVFDLASGAPVWSNTLPFGVIEPVVAGGKIVFSSLGRIYGVTP